MAWRMVSSDTLSSCGPHPNDQPPPPIAHAPKPTVVISRPLEPSGRLLIFMIAPLVRINSPYWATSNFSAFRQLQQILKPLLHANTVFQCEGSKRRVNELLLALC